MLKGQRVLVVGTGLSGSSAESFLKRVGAEVICCNSDARLSKEVEAGIQGVVLSPGVPTDAPLINAFRGRGIPVIGELELGFLAEKGRVIAITGTNGKTTTTTLVWEIMKAHLGEEKAFLVGNIGIPYTSKVLDSAADTVSVAEVSSFQLETIDTFHPTVSAILNITPDHLDRHRTMEAYVAAKEAITKNQTEEQICVLNYDNSYTRAFADGCPVKAVCFSSQEELWNGYFVRGDKIVKSVEGNDTELLDIRRDIHLTGVCNVENVMAALAVADAMQVPTETAIRAVRQFGPVEHRIEFVATVKGVDYYNDSKATNPDAAIQGIRAMKKPTVLLGGGYDKKNSYDEWLESFDGKVKWLVLMGQTKEAIAKAAAGCGFTNVRLANTYKEAFRMCTVLAEEGDAVLLSPACASFGMFADYEERGRLFKAYVKGLEAGKNL
ncbi:MAG: UDP-N-acetylmuramoyl-L-alanine--D-glutamate ligase [Clostridium sp.]|nr:UDP-N-acetylmuramoyl-L-alanine--D-glutamate ligase [Clostridium sp.]